MWIWSLVISRVTREQRYDSFCIRQRYNKTFFQSRADHPRLWTYITFVWPWLWPHGLRTWPWPRYYEDVLSRQQLSFWIKAFKIRAEKDRQKTDRRDWKYCNAAFTGGDKIINNFLVLWSQAAVKRIHKWYDFLVLNIIQWPILATLSCIHYRVTIQAYTYRYVIQKYKNCNITNSDTFTPRNTS